MGAPYQASVSSIAGGPSVTTPISLRTTWVTAYDNVSATADVSGVLRNPLTYTAGANVALIHPIIVAQGTRLAVRCKYDDGVTLVTTSPTVQLFAFDQQPDSTGAFAAGTKFWRLDATDPSTAGQVLTLNATADINDGTFNYSSNGPGLSTYDMFGASSIMVLHDTASVVSGGANTTVAVEISILN
jgi:hypothetical protein